jgi:4-amino-4-deoxy-L-arabinose transferase-like glycosyltransferase
MPRIPLWIFALLAVLYFSATRVDLMDIDATQYAEISREMAQSGNYLHIHDRGNNYLDKPPMLFWTAALSIQCLGPTNFAYKLPSLLMALLALYATYRVAKLLYDENTGRVAALILGTSQGMFLMTNDVRCDLMLMGWVITAIWLLKEWSLNRRWLYFAGGSIAVAFGMMTKGPIGLLAPAFALGTDWVLKRDWKQFLRWQYLLLLVIVLLILLPMSIGLYQQFDLHQGKFVNGKSGTSGLKFYYWTQSFGRITGENDWNNGSDISFQLVNMLWSFLPWIFVLLPALFLNIRTLIRQKARLNPQQEWLSTGGFLLCYLAVGLSKYQLPHYIFVAFPLAAIACAQLIRDCYELKLYPKLTSVLTKIISIAGILLFTGVLLILTLVFPAGIFWLLLCGFALALYFFIALRKGLKGKIVIAGAAAMMLINIFLTHHFYYRLMQYQVGIQAGKYISEQKIPAHEVIAYRMHDPLNSLHYYARQVIRVKDDAGYLPPSAQYVLTQQEGLDELQQRGYGLQVLLSDRLFKVSELTPDFININKRDKATSPYYFCKISRPGNSLAQ